MQTIVVASRKGGSGKTTVTAHLAVAAHQESRGPVALLDLDPQASLAAWWNDRAQEEPYYLRTDLDRLGADKQRLADAGLRLLVIDTPPSYHASMDQVLEQADLVIIPCRPSPHDLRSIGATVAQVEAVKKPFVFVLNAAAWGARITAEAAAVLSERGPLSPAILYNRVNLASGMVDGMTVLESRSGSKASDEVRALWRDVADRLGRIDQNKSVEAVPDGRSSYVPLAYDADQAIL